MNMIKHDFYSFNSPTLLLTDFFKDYYDVFAVSENRFAIFDTPHEVRVDVTNRMGISNGIRHNNNMYYFDYMVI